MSSTTYFFMHNAKGAQKLSHADALEGFNIIGCRTTVNSTHNEKFKIIQWNLVWEQKNVTYKHDDVW